MEEMHIAYQAYCKLKTKAVRPRIRIPKTLRPAPHLEITNLPLFITTALTRLESNSPLLRGIAERNLMAVINTLEHGK